MTSRAARLLLPLLLACGAMPLGGQTVARMQASATVAEPVQAAVQGARVQSAGGPVQVEVDVSLRGAIAWYVGADEPAGEGTPAGVGAPECGVWTGGTGAPPERDDDPNTPRPVQRLTATVRCAAPAAGELAPRPLVVRVMAIN